MSLIQAFNNAMAAKVERLNAGHMNEAAHAQCACVCVGGGRGGADSFTRIKNMADRDQSCFILHIFRRFSLIGPVLTKLK